MNTNGSRGTFYRFAASVHYEVEHSNPNHADVEACPICGRTGDYAGRAGNLVELVHDPLGLELVLSGTIRGQRVRFEDYGQREVGSQTKSFNAALRSALHEDPDVILVGELRDLETTQLALTAAETGHLVFATLHTASAPKTIDRIIDIFPPEQQAQIRVMLSESLKGVIAQTLCRKIGGGRVAALEVLLTNGAISNLIREGKTFQIPSMMQVGRAQGMISLNDALAELVKKGLVAPEEAILRAVDKAGFEALLKRR